MNLTNAYNQIKAELNAQWMSEPTTESLQVTSNSHCQNDQAWSKIRDFQPKQGWIQTLDEVHLIENGQLPKNEDNLISAELVNANNESLHIRPSSRGQLSLVHFTPNQGQSYYVIQTAHQIKHGKKNGTAHYKLYWQFNTPQTQPALSRLIEINQLEKK